MGPPPPTAGIKSYMVRHRHFKAFLKSYHMGKILPSLFLGRGRMLNASQPPHHTFDVLIMEIFDRKLFHKRLKSSTKTLLPELHKISNISKLTMFYIIIVFKRIPFHLFIKLVNYFKSVQKKLQKL